MRTLVKRFFFLILITVANSSTVAGQEKDLQKEIDNAIDKGVNFLLSHQQNDGSFTAAQGGFPTGMTALALYAMVKSGLPKSHHAVQRAAEFIRSNPPIKTYSCACQLMALAALNLPRDKKLLNERAQLLISWQRGTYGYPTGTPDLSNTQYAALGLRAAAKGGIDIPAKVWMDLGDATLDHKVGGRKGYGPVGFCYRPKGKATGSMTTAGIAILAICEEQLKTKGRRVVAFQRAREGGVEWMAKNFSVDNNPPGGSNNWRLHYYLYGLERVGDLLGIKKFGEHDWYKLGARKWIKTQARDGNWNAWGNYKQEDTAFGVLFLARATSGVSGRTPLLDRKYGEIDEKNAFSMKASGDTPLTVWLAAFGNPVRGDIWPDDKPANGPRVASVEYYTQRSHSLTSNATTGSAWKFMDGKVASGFEQISMSDGHWAKGEMPFGMPSRALIPYQTSIESKMVTARKMFNWNSDLHPRPELRVRVTPGDVMSTDIPPTDNHVWLFNENADFLKHIGTLQEGCQLSISEDDVASGEKALRLTYKQAYSTHIPGWGFRITKKPRKGEYRYLRYAWKKVGGKQIMMQLVNSGSWGLRYAAGLNLLNWKPAFQIQEDIPEEWEVVTRDLYEDFGNKDAVVTGIAFASANEGTALFDSIQLGRRKSDLKTIKRTPKKPKSKPMGPTQVWLNESLIWSSKTPVPELKAIDTLLPLGDVIKKGENLLVVQSPWRGPHQIVDVKLVTDEVIGRITEAKPRPIAGRRMPMQHRFVGVGKRQIAATVHLALADGTTRAVAVPPLMVDITDAIDPDVLSYATDRARNLLLGGERTVSASSVSDKRWAARAFDGFVGTDWLPADTDPNPTLSIRLMKPVRGNMIRISHGNMKHIDRQRTARIRRIRVRVNGARGGTDITMNQDVMRKTTIRLPRPMVISRLQITILETNPGFPGKPAAGIGEVEVMHDK